MDIAWIIIDGLSFSATPFTEDGPDTMPNLERLARKHGVVFTEAFAPGPLSPSSHAAMFTGQLPSAVGMHEAHPYFESDAPTIATALREEYQTHLVTGNEWLFQGLDADFDNTFDFGRSYLVFREASDPSRYFHSNVARYKDFVADSVRDRTLVKSLVNALRYKFDSGYGIMPKGWGDSENYQYARAQTDEVRNRLAKDGKQFVLANYMDVHAPIEASEQAIEQFSNEGGDLPTGVSPERHKFDEEKSYDVDRMGQLYYASIWDVDRKLAPFIEEAIGSETLVVVTSDHGRTDTGTAYSDQRLHIPLIIFAPDERARRVQHTVNVRSIAATITSFIGTDAVEFEGRSLLSIDADQTSITEIIHHPNDVYRRTHRVDITRLPDTADEEIQHDVVLQRGDARGEYIAGALNVENADPTRAEEFEAICRELQDVELHGTQGDGIDTDPVTERRLEDLGYI